MRISVITVCFNCRDAVQRTIDSVAAQTDVDVEHIVVDGGSSDGTVELLKERSIGSLIKKECSISRWVSEPDEGIYDAMNKGWRMCTGDIVGFLNSDDVYADSSVLQRLAEKFAVDRSDAVYGDLDLVGAHDQVVRSWKTGEFRRFKYHLGWMTPHPVTYVRRSLFETYGGFRTDLPISADYELMLRFFYKHGASVRYLPDTLVHMRAGGASNGSLRGIAQANWQVYKSWKLNGLRTTPVVLVSKPLSKLAQLRPGFLRTKV